MKRVTFILYNIIIYFILECIFALWCILAVIYKEFKHILLFLAQQHFWIMFFKTETYWVTTSVESICQTGSEQDITAKKHSLFAIVSRFSDWLCNFSLYIRIHTYYMHIFNY